MTPAPLLSSHGAQIPALGFGTSPMTGGLSPDTVVAALHAGYRHIDTAWKYGTERAVGEAMRASGVPRGDIFLTTKVSHEYLRADAFAKSVSESLAALKVSYVDPVLAAIAKARGKSIAQIALRWLMQQNVAAIPRSSNPARIADNFKVFDFTLSDGEMQRIDALKRLNGRIANPVERVSGGWD